ncbi:MAG: DNA polymerase III subunit gamma/tau [Verrucomicrobiota bacterium]
MSSPTGKSYEVFARKYRPKTFDDVLGQDHVVQTLRNAIEQNRLAHAYLFVGPRGTGKTSTARVFAKALNGPGGPKMDFDPDDPACIEIAEGRHVDVLEIDGASNNGVDQVRDLRETVSYAPMSGSFKIYYIDEVHMLSTAAFNALLKTLEEPPPHVKFIFATTEANKILPTIISRCQRFDLRRIPDNIIADHLLHIAKEESIKLDPVAAHAIARGAEGGMRDAQSMLDQLVAFCGESIEEKNVLDVFGFTAHETVASLAGALLRFETVNALELIYAQDEAGKDLARLLTDLINYFRTLLVAKVDPDRAVAEVAPAVAGTLLEQKDLVDNERLLAVLDCFSVTDARMKWAPNKRLHFEIGVIKAVQELESTRLSDVIQAVSAGGEIPSAPASSPAPAPVAQAQRPAAKAPAPAPAVSAPAESTAAEPAPVVSEAAPAPSGHAPADASAWQTVLDNFAATKPIVHGYAGKANFLRVENNEFVVGLPAAEPLTRDALLRDRMKAQIEAAIAQVTGQPYSLVVELKEGMAPAKKAAAPEIAPAPAPAAKPKEKPPEEPKPEPAAEKRSNEEPPAADEDIYNDPKIKAALELFDGEIESLTKS